MMYMNFDGGHRKRVKVPTYDDEKMIYPFALVAR